MSYHILFAEDEEAHGRVNIDELYDKNMKRDLKQLSVFNKILNRIHKRIQLTAKNKRCDKFIWFTVPEFLFGEPTYDQGDCIGYLVSKLADNGFHVRYIHPNTLFVSWEQWVPSYVRTEFKKKTGKTVDEKGNVLDPHAATEEAPDAASETPGPGGAAGKQYTPIGQYKPSGNLVYNSSFFEKLEQKMSKDP